MPESKMYTSTFCPPFSIFCGFCPSQKDAEDVNVFAQTPSPIVFCGARVSSEGSVDARFFLCLLSRDPTTSGGCFHRRRLLSHLATLCDYSVQTSQPTVRRESSRRYTQLCDAQVLC